MSIEMEKTWQIKLQKDNGIIVTFGFDPKGSADDIDLGIRAALSMPKSAIYSVVFRGNESEEDICFLPTGRMLTNFLAKKVSKLDVLVVPAKPERQSCKLSLKRGSELRPHVLPSLQHRQAPRRTTAMLNDGLFSSIDWINVSIVCKRSRVSQIEKKIYDNLTRISFLLVIFILLLYIANL